MEFYLEQKYSYGRSASLAWRVDGGGDGFYLGGNADEHGNERFYLYITKFGADGT